MPYPCPENIKIISNTPIELILSQEHIYTNSDKYESIFVILVILLIWINPFAKKTQTTKDKNLFSTIISICVGVAISLLFIFGMIEPIFNDKYYNNFKVTTQFIEFEKVMKNNLFKTEKTKIDLQNVKQLYLIPPRDYNNKSVHLYAINDKNEKIDLKFSWGLHEAETILFIVQEAEKFLKIKDIPVEGEYKE
jgi:hypothetical protein